MGKKGMPFFEDRVLTDTIEIEPKGESCLFIATGTYRIGWIGKAFFNAAIEKGLTSVKQHMKEEGQNLKAILET